MTTAEDILRLAHIYAIKGDYEPFRTAVESLVAERDEARAALSAPAVPEAVLAERKRLANRLRYETELEGFGCACSPLRLCATCNAREVLRKVLAPLIGELDAAPQPQEQT